jgi:hypothetical protein
MSFTLGDLKTGSDFVQIFSIFLYNFYKTTAKIKKKKKKNDII